MSKEKQDLDRQDVDRMKRNLRDARFLNRMAKYCTVEKQMDEADKKCEELEVDVRDTFHVVGTTKEGDKTLLHIITSGKEGEKSARETLQDVADAKELDIANASTERYDEKEDAPFLTKMIDDKLEELYPGYHKRHGLKRRWL